MSQIFICRKFYVAARTVHVVPTDTSLGTGSGRWSWQQTKAVNWSNLRVHLPFEYIRAHMHMASLHNPRGWIGFLCLLITNSYCSWCLHWQQRYEKPSNTVTYPIIQWMGCFQLWRLLIPIYLQQIVGYFYYITFHTNGNVDLKIYIYINNSFRDMRQKHAPY